MIFETERRFEIAIYCRSINFLMRNVVRKMKLTMFLVGRRRLSQPILPLGCLAHIPLTVASFFSPRILSGKECRSPDEVIIDAKRRKMT